MKKIIVFLILLFSVSFSTFAQMHGRMNGPRKKIEELEKIKLLEVLHLNEPTMLKFFSRRDEYQNQIMKLNESQDDILHQMEERLKKDNGDKNDPEIKKLIDNYLSIQNKIAEKRVDFIKSVSDMLTDTQIAKYLVFEKKFREEIRDLFFKERMRMHRK